jgi:hypothetical protein
MVEIDKPHRRGQRIEAPVQLMINAEAAVEHERDRAIAHLLHRDPRTWDIDRPHGPSPPPTWSSGDPPSIRRPRAYAATIG